MKVIGLREVEEEGFLEEGTSELRPGDRSRAEARASGAQRGRWGRRPCRTSQALGGTSVCVKNKALGNCRRICC